jgi:predicted membrane chloride channel (bestrophin family)
VFRTNTNYQRFDGARPRTPRTRGHTHMCPRSHPALAPAQHAESRRLWGSIVNRSRDLVRQGMVWFPDDKAHLKPALVKWVVALAQCVRLHMRAPRDDTPAALAGWLSADELAGLAAAAHRPNHCLQVLSHIIATGSPEAHTAHRLDEDLKFLEDTIGGCERVYRTPIPLSYTRHTSRLLLFWLAYMPAALFSELNIHALLVAPMLVLVLFGIDEIGVELEEPFSILPLEVLCDAVKAQSLELLASDADVKGLVAGYARGGAEAAALPPPDGGA